jgi:hypothetical protein
MEEDPERTRSRGGQKQACSVVWTGIPLISWLVPAIGHVGVTDSSGMVYDFQGDGMIGRGKMLFGEPRQQWRLDVSPRIMDQAIEGITEEFSRRSYSFFCSNCHFYAASVLEKAGVKPPCCCGNWRTGATAKIIWSLILHGRSNSACDFFLIWIPFLVLVGIIVILVLLSRGVI